MIGSRRDFLRLAGNGFGALAFAALAQHASAEKQTPAALRQPTSDPMAPKSSHFPARATNVIFLYMDGGPSQIDTFDPKPKLEQYHGKPYPGAIPRTQFDDVGKVYACPWKFRQYGQSGIPVSELFPHVAGCVDDLAILRSLTAPFSEHTNANYFLHTGSGLQGRPSHGAWVTYGLGSDADNLPGFVVLNGGLIPPGGQDCYGNGFLSAIHQGSVLQMSGEPIPNLTPALRNAQRQQRKRKLIQSLDSHTTARLGKQDSLESAIANAELAARMQLAVPELIELGGESPATQQLYGLDDPFPQTRIYARQCLLARRLVERGVRFVELLCPAIGGHDRWDQHSNLKSGHEANARAVDRPIAGLLRDLKARGLLESTVVVWAGEFGRTPMAQGSNGRDHNPFGFTVWLAGGGVRGGTVYGATDEFGYHAIENKVTMHDLHATLLYLLGMDHTKLTFRHGGRDMRLTDVHGEIVTGIL